MTLDSLLVRELDSVLLMCRSAGWQVEVEYTVPPRGEVQGRYRVLKCSRIADGKLKITAAREMEGKEV